MKPAVALKLTAALALAALAGAARPALAGPRLPQLGAGYRPGSGPGYTYTPPPAASSGAATAPTYQPYHIVNSAPARRLAYGRWWTQDGFLLDKSGNGKMAHAYGGYLYLDRLGNVNFVSDAEMAAASDSGW